MLKRDTSAFAGAVRRNSPAEARRQGVAWLGLRRRTRSTTTNAVRSGISPATVAGAQRLAYVDLSNNEQDFMSCKADLRRKDFVTGKGRQPLARRAHRPKGHGAAWCSAMFTCSPTRAAMTVAVHRHSATGGERRGGQVPRASGRQHRRAAVLSALGQERGASRATPWCASTFRLEVMWPVDAEIVRSSGQSRARWRGHRHDPQRQNSRSELRLRSLPASASPSTAGLTRSCRCFTSSSSSRRFRRTPAT